MPTILSIQVLRAVAALAVVLVHAGLASGYWGYTPLPWTYRGSAGVDLFFAISGFIMVYVAWDAYGSSRAAAEFFARRLIRIVPLYWLITAVHMLLNRYDPFQVLASFLFLPRGGEAPIVNVGWSLNFEMMFYVVFAAALTLPRHYALICVAAGITALGLTGLSAPYAFPSAFNDSIVIEFVFGLAVGTLYCRGVRLPGVIRAGLMLVALLIFVYPLGPPRLLHYGVPAALVVAAAVLGAPLRPTRMVLALAALGEASYALYLTHWHVVRNVGNIMRSLGIDFALLWPLFLLVAFGASIGAALLVHRYVELPILNMLKRLLARSAVAEVRPTVASAPTSLS
jgi:exopolysaccharide production protein ExoZ